MWMSSLDTRTGAHPVDDSRPAHIGRRVYRNIDASQGCTLYWDQPSLTAARILREVTGDTSYSAVAAAYVLAFLGKCVAPNGVFLRGNHYHYDKPRETVVRFVNRE